MRKIVVLIILITALAIPFVSMAGWEWSIYGGDEGIGEYIWIGPGYSEDLSPPGVPPSWVGIDEAGLMQFTPSSCVLEHDLTDYPKCVLPKYIATNYTACCLIDKILTIGDWIFVLLLVVAIIVFLLAAWGFLTAQGDPEKVKNARNYLIYSIIGVAVAFLAKVLVRVVASIMA